ncbi:MAG: hypothetical protein LIO77_10975 [Rikenellaceae bacterium]|nr:hypothetical protein [Rikenellaceae bacterium]
MCSRFLPLAVAIAAAVSCGRGRAVAAAEETSVPGKIQTEEAAPAAPATVSVSDDGHRFLFDGPYYSADLVWNEGQVSFCDMHICHGPGSPKDLPVMDSKLWSGPQRQAGIYFMESIPGVGLNIIKCKDPRNEDKGEGSLSLEWDDQYGYRSFRMKMDDGTVNIEGYDPASGQPIDNWFLSLVTAREKGNDLPFTVIVPERVNSIVGGREYHLGIGPGKAALNTEDTPPVFNIYPENGVITLIFKD